MVVIWVEFPKSIAAQIYLVVGRVSVMLNSLSQFTFTMLLGNSILHYYGIAYYAVTRVFFCRCTHTTAHTLPHFMLDISISRALY